jgi:2-polyprenyl-6-methoxyphenol hydroxylase-like FAD-dependent oxidoreductase
VARSVDAPVEELGAGVSGVVYGRWAGVELDGYEWFYRPGVSAGLIPTNGGEVCVFAACPPERLRAELADDAPGGYRRLLAEAAPGLVDRLDAGRAPRSLRTFGGHPGFVRRSWGRGWVLVGDAGAFTDPISAHGITDALRDAELASRAVVAVLDGADEAGPLAAYQAERDRLGGGVMTAADAIATYRWDLPTVHRLLLALSSAMSAEVEALAALPVPLRGPLGPLDEPLVEVRRPA